ncbi:MAG: hypothetical protein DK306_000008 [Chloroflexi bacterium]|nr:MAG: hypothetical protein DK306_000008 [Chloroflexota bacterium]
MAYDGFDLTGKVAVITGGNSGIGLGFAKAVAEAGAQVSIWGTNPDKNAAAQAELQQISPSASAIRCDVSDEHAVNDSIAAVVAEYGRVDALFANAGIGNQNDKPFFEHTTEDWQRVIDVNLTGAFFTLRAASKQMVDQGEGGSLILTSSGTAIQGAPKGQAYAATKGGLVAMTLGLAVGLARYNINANAVIPGWVETPMTQRVFENEKFNQAVIPRIPFRRYGTPDDFGAIAVYLMSDAARWHTGDVIKIDGGFSIF